MFVKTSLGDRLDCLVDSVGMILLRLLPTCLPSACGSLHPTFFRICFPTLFAADLKDFLPLKTSPISGAANSNMLAPMRFAAGTIYLHKKGIAVLPIPCARAPNLLPLCLPNPLWNFYLSWSNRLVEPYVLEMNVGHLSKHQNKPSDTDRYKGYFVTRCVYQINVYNMRRVFEQRSKL